VKFLLYEEQPWQTLRINHHLFVYHQKKQGIEKAVDQTHQQNQQQGPNDSDAFPTPSPSIPFCRTKEGTIS